MLNPRPGNDDYSGRAFLATAGENLALGEVCYQKADGKYWKAKADTVATMPAVVLAAAAISADMQGLFLQGGFIRHDDWAPWTLGGLDGLIYPSATAAGAITQEAPAASGNQRQKVGYATPDEYTETHEGLSKTLFFQANLNMVVV